MIALAGAAMGILLTFPVAAEFSKQVGTLFPVFGVSMETVYMQAAAAAAVGLAASVLPALRAARVPIVDGLRSIG
jgi:putative ABC transport system permease protein